MQFADTAYLRALFLRQSKDFLCASSIEGKYVNVSNAYKCVSQYKEKNQEALLQEMLTWKNQPRNSLKVLERLKGRIKLEVIE